MSWFNTSYRTFLVFPLASRYALNDLATDQSLAADCMLTTFQLIHWFLINSTQLNSFLSYSCTVTQELCCTVLKDETKRCILLWYLAVWRVAAGRPSYCWELYIFCRDSAPAHRDERETVWVVWNKTPDFVIADLWPAVPFWLWCFLSVSS